MPEQPIDNRGLIRRTLIMVSAMVGGCVVLVGMLTLIASTVVDKAVGGSADDTTKETVTHAVGAAAKPPPPGTAKSK
jgi:hypothetical protein